MKIGIAVLEGKGGVAKSTIAATSILALRSDGKRTVKIFDGDTTNSCMVSMFGDEATLLDFAEPDAAARLSVALRSVYDSFVLDTGARDEAKILEMFSDLAAKASKAKIPLVQFRPITLSSFVQNNAASAVRRLAPLGVKTVLVKVLAQGRTETHYRDWDSSKTKAELLKHGAVEMSMTDLGVRWADEAAAFGLSYHEIAFGQFDRVPEHLRGYATKLFDENAQEHFTNWLEKNCKRILDALFALGIKL